MYEFCDGEVSKEKYIFRDRGGWFYMERFKKKKINNVWFNVLFKIIDVLLWIIKEG